MDILNEKSFFLREKNGNAVIKNTVSRDASIPDYLPDMERPLFCRTTFENESVMPGENGFTNSFCAEFELFYADENGNVSSFGFKKEFSDKKELAGCDEDAVVFADNRIENLTLKPLGKRKINVKSDVVSTVYPFTSRDVSPVSATKSGKKSDIFDVEKKQKTEDFTEVCKRTFQGIRLSGDIPLGNDADERTEAITTDIKLYTVSAELSGGAILFEGKAEAAALIFTPSEDGGKYEEVRAVFDLKEDLDAGVTPEKAYCVFAKLTPTDVSAVISPGEDGSRRLELDLSYDAAFDIYTSCKKEYVEDAFSPEHPTDISEGSAEAFGISDIIRKNFTHSDRIALEKVPDDILFSTSDARIETIETEDGKVRIEGKISATLLTLSEDGRPDRTGVDSRFKYEFPVKIPDPETRASVFASDVRIKKDGDALSLVCEIRIACAVFEKKEVRFVKKIFIDDETQINDPDRNKTRMIYPTENESEWDLCRRFGVKRSDFRAANSDPSYTRTVVIPKTKDRNA